MADTQLNFRFAPSPNGHLHLGHAHSALTTFEMAKRYGGTFHLRIEDIDVARSRSDFISAIKEDLAWLGLSWPEPVLLQSERIDAYRAATRTLQNLGVLYPCAATRSEIHAAANRHGAGFDPDGAPLYTGRGTVISEADTSARIAQGDPFALRIDIKAALAIAGPMLGGKPLQFSELAETGGVARHTCDAERWGDVIIVRKDVPASYHLAVVVDDAFQYISHVTRGEDLRAATDIQRLLQVLLELPEPIYDHHTLILDNTGKKLSKSDGATSLRALRQNGKTPGDIKELIQSNLETPGRNRNP